MEQCLVGETTGANHEQTEGWAPLNRPRGVLPESLCNKIVAGRGVKDLGGFGLFGKNFNLIGGARVFKEY